MVKRADSLHIHWRCTWRQIEDTPSVKKASISSTLSPERTCGRVWGACTVASVRFGDQGPYRDHGQGHVVMPALPRAHLVCIHSRLSLSSLTVGFDADISCDHPSPFRQQRLLQLRLGYPRRSEIIAVAIAGILIRGIPRGVGLQRPIVCEGMTGDH
jgi:hypothetical protein